MRNSIRLAAALAVLGAFAPIAANADVGTSIYQPGPIISHAKPMTEQHHASIHRVADGRSAYSAQIKALRANHNARADA